MSTIDTNSIKSLGLSTTPAAKRKDQLGQEDFLKLMTTQLANQDPLKPMQSGEFMTQMAQFGTVQGVQDLQKSFAAFAGSMASGQNVQAAALVGHQVLVPAAQNVLGTGGLGGAVDLPANAAGVAVGVYNAGGELVRRLMLGSQSQGLVRYHWDGVRDDGTQAAPGAYQIKAEAVIGDSSVELPNLAQARVDSVTLGKPGRGLTVDLAGIGETAFSQLREIR